MAEPALQQDQEGLFPPALDQVPESERTGEAFGFMPAIFGAAAVVLGVLVLMPSTRGNRQAQLLAGAALVVFGVVLAFLEVRRRQNRTTFVLRGDRLGIYRAGLLAATLDRAGVLRYQLDFFNTFRYVFPVLCFVAVFGFLTLDGKVSPSERVGFGCAAGAMVAALVSVVRTRIILRHYLVPKGNRNEEVMLSREDAARLFPG